MKRILPLLWLICMFWGTVYALNDMPLLAQLQGEHNGSAFGYSIVSLDFNHDNYDDLIVLSGGYGWVYPYTPSRGKVNVYYGGPGFSSTSEPAMTLEGDYPQGMQRKIGLIINVGDVSGDGYDDLMIGDAIPNVTSSARCMIFYGGATNLTTPNIIVVPLPNEENWRIYELGDVDGDGFDDLGICYTLNYILNFDIMWGGSFQRQLILSGLGMFNDTKAIIGIGDIDNDGFHDFSIGYLEDELKSEQYSIVRVYYGNNNRIFSDFILLIHTSYSNTRICKPLGDLNNDGYDDFLGYIGNSGMNVWFGTNTSLSFDPNVILYPVLFGNSNVRGVNHGDFNGDGFSDVVGASYQARRFAVWLGSTSMDGHSDWQKGNTLENYGYDVAVGDLNGDGYDDIAVSAPFEQGMWPYHDYRGYVFIYAGNPGMVANDDLVVPQLSDQLQMKLSPNPVPGDGVISISIAGIDKEGGTPLKVEIYNLKGQLVHQAEINDVSPNETVIPVDMSMFPSGVYLCRARIDGQTVTKRFTIIK